MAKIIIRADGPGDEAGLITLSEHLVAENLDSAHYAAQLVERIGWAARDAEALETQGSTASARHAGVPVAPTEVASANQPSSITQLARGPEPLAAR